MSYSRAKHLGTRMREGHDTVRTPVTLSTDHLIYEKDDLLAPLLPGMVEAPHEMMISDDHHDYYRGKLLPIHPVGGDEK